MVKKLILQVENTCDNNSSQQSLHYLFALNKTLYDIVTKYKDKITQYYKNKSWDKYKKLSNEYELVFYAPNANCNVSLYNPISRSFFKLWELVHDFDDILGVTQEKPIKSVFLAEGPGGFVEAFYKKRKDHDYAHLDTYYGITLKSKYNKMIPDWKMKNDLPINISYGKDGTGNLYNIENINHFVEEVGKNTVDFLTADGGFDFSSDFNNQEEQSYRLLVSEVLMALLLQKEGGSFILKVYDCFNDDTIKLLQILNKCYTTIFFIKPLTSRPANSERYILCTHFKPPVCNQVKKYVQLLRNMVICYDEKFNQRILSEIAIEYNFMYSIVNYNMLYTMRQIYYIQKTINYINFFIEKGKGADDVMNVLLDKHTNKSKKWCTKYMIPFRS